MSKISLDTKVKVWNDGEHEYTLRQCADVFGECEGDEYGGHYVYLTFADVGNYGTDKGGYFVKALRIGDELDDELNYAPKAYEAWWFMPTVDDSDTCDPDAEPNWDKPDLIADEPQGFDLSKLA